MYRLILIGLLGVLTAPITLAEGEQSGGHIRLDETVISGNQELPKVLYILPWREPQGLPHLETNAEMTEAEVFRRLYPPAYRRELSYFETLNRFKENQHSDPDQED